MGLCQAQFPRLEGSAQHLECGTGHESAKEVGPGRTLAQGDTREARLSTEGCLALVTIFGLVRRQLGSSDFNCLQSVDDFQSNRCY